MRIFRYDTMVSLVKPAAADRNPAPVPHYAATMLMRDSVWRGPHQRCDRCAAGQRSPQQQQHVSLLRKWLHVMADIMNKHTATFNTAVLSSPGLRGTTSAPRGGGLCRHAQTTPSRWL